MGKGKSRGGGVTNSNRKCGKAWKKFIKVYDPEKKRLVRVPNTKH